MAKKRLPAYRARDLATSAENKRHADRTRPVPVRRRAHGNVATGGEAEAVAAGLTEPTKGSNRRARAASRADRDHHPSSPMVQPVAAGRAVRAGLFGAGLVAVGEQVAQHAGQPLGIAADRRAVWDIHRHLKLRRSRGGRGGLRAKARPSQCARAARPGVSPRARLSVRAHRFAARRTDCANSSVSCRLRGSAASANRAEANDTVARMLFKS